MHTKDRDEARSHFPQDQQEDNLRQRPRPLPGYWLGLERLKHI